VGLCHLMSEGPEECAGSAREALRPRRPAEQQTRIEEGEQIEQYAETSRRYLAPGAWR